MGAGDGTLLDSIVLIYGLPSGNGMLSILTAGSDEGRVARDITRAARSVGRRHVAARRVAGGTCGAALPIRR